MTRPYDVGRIYRVGRYVWIAWSNSNHEQIRESTKLLWDGPDAKAPNMRKAKAMLKDRLAKKHLGMDKEIRGIAYDHIRSSYLRELVNAEGKSLPRRRNGKLILDREGLPRLNAITKLDEFFSGYRLKHITADALDEFVSDLKSKAYSNGSINRSLSSLQAMFKAAKDRKDIREMPTYWPRMREANPRSGFAERDEYERLLTALPAELKPVLAIGFETGMRRGEILNLKWEQIDFLDELMVLHPGETKNDEGREVPITSEMHRELLARKRACPPDCPWIAFKFDRKGHWHKIDAFGKRWNVVCVKLGLGQWVRATDPVTGEELWEKPRGPRSKPKPKMTYEGRLFHDMRRSGIRTMVRAGIDPTIAMKISGHKTASIFRCYNIVSTKDIKDAGRKLEEFASAERMGRNRANPETAQPEDVVKQ
jgi:integrase